MPAKNSSEILQHPEQGSCPQSLQKVEGNRHECQDHGKATGGAVGIVACRDITV